MIREPFDRSQIESEADHFVAFWRQACDRLLAAVDESRRLAAMNLLEARHAGGSGLRYWISAVAWRGSPLPDAIPNALIDVYLHDPDAAPLNECESCGVSIPVRRPRHQVEDAGAQICFVDCPVCGGRTGWYLHQAKAASATSQLRRSKPR